MSLFPDDDRPKPVKTEIGAIVDPVDRFVRFIVEREAIRLRRAAGLSWRPSDIILRDYCFCNIHREDDHTTREIVRLWLAPLADHADAWFAAAVARHTNLVPMIEELGMPLPWEPDHFVAVAKDREARGERWYSTAYRIRPDNHAEARGEKKYIYVAHRVLTPLWQARKTLRPREGDTLDVFHRRLIECEGIGGFIGAQIVADTKYSGVLRSASDWSSWAASGRGSRRGLNLVLGRPVNAAWDEDDWRRQLKWLRAEIANDLVKAGIGKLHAQDLQNCLCEFARYEKLRLREGTGRRFVPRR